MNNVFNPAGANPGDRWQTVTLFLITFYESMELMIRMVREARCPTRINESFFRESVKNDPKAPVIVGHGMIACNTPALQE